MESQAFSRIYQITLSEADFSIDSKSFSLNRSILDENKKQNTLTIYSINVILLEHFILLSVITISTTINKY